jgi:hypothetical protein
MSNLIKDRKFHNSFKKFRIELIKQKPELLNKDYFYVTIWNLGCQPCLDEITVLDSLPNEFDKNIAYVMVSAHSNKAVESYLKRNNIEIINFFLINEMVDFIFGIYNELELKNLILPLHVIFDKKEHPLAYLIGAINNRVNAMPMINYINSLP